MKNHARIFGALWAVGFGLAVLPVPPQEIMRMLAVVVAVVSLLGIVWCGRPLPEKVFTAPRIGFLLLLLMILVLVSAAWSVAPSVTLLYAGAFTVIPASVLALMIADQDQRVDFIRAAVWGTGSIIVAVAAWAIIQTFFFPQLLVNGQVRHPFVNPNVFAAMLNMAIFAGLGLYMSTPSPRHRRILWVGLLIVLVAFASVASKAGSITFFVGLIMMAVMVHQSDWRRSGKELMILAGIVMIMALIMSTLPGKTSIWGQLGSYARGDYATAMNRIDIWAATVHLIQQSPLLGSGYRTFYLMYPSVRLPSEVFSSGLMTHSDPLQLWSEIGVAGIVLFYAIGFGVLGRFVRAHRISPSVIRTGLFIAAAGLVAHSHVDFPLYSLPVGMVFALCLSGLLICTARPEDKAVVPFAFVRSWPKANAFMLLVLPTVMIMGLFMSMMMSEYYLNLGKKQINEGNTEGFATSINLANKMGLGMNARPYLMAATVPLGILKDGFMSIDLDEQRALFKQADGLLLDALHRNSRLASVPFQRAELIGNSIPLVWPEDFPPMENLFREALAIDPLYLPARMGLARNLRAKGRGDELYELILDGLHWPYPGYEPMAFYALASEQAKLCNDEATLAEIDGLIKLYEGRIETARTRQADWDQLKDFLP